MKTEYSDTEAQRILNDAIHRQMSEEELQTGLTKKQIYEIAREIDLDRRYVRRALAINSELSGLEERAKSKALKLENKRDLANNVNALLRKAFGLFKRIRGDMRASNYGAYVNDDRSLEAIYELNLFGLFETFVGEFTSLDGSSLRIHFQCVKQAKRYAELYKAKYGKDVQIEIGGSH